MALDTTRRCAPCGKYYNNVCIMYVISTIINTYVICKSCVQITVIVRIYYVDFYVLVYGSADSGRWL